MRVLLTEDNVELAAATTLNLKKHGFAVDIAYSGEEAINLMEGNGEYDVVVLDLILPDIDGATLLRNFKSLVPNVPVLALTARDTEEDRVNGLRIGFDDYLTKPFSHHELAARLRVLCRSRYYRLVKTIKIGPLQIHPASHRVLVRRSLVKLTLTEFRLLLYLARHKDWVVSGEELLRSVWDRNTPDRKTKVITAISRLRKKIGDYHKDIIKTCKNGYAIEPTNA